MGKITYYVKNNKCSLYLNIVDNYLCTNDCVFCDKEVLQKAVKNNLLLRRKPTFSQIKKAIDLEIKKSKPNEIVFCGIAEPTVYFDELLKTIRYIKSKHDIKIRLNTNGHARLINPVRNCVKELKIAGLDIASVSLNSTSKEEYGRLHHPKDKENSFDAVIKFIKDCEKEGLDVCASFILFPGLDKEKVFKYAKKIGISKQGLKFRKIIG